jgi:hypothetical protein
MKASTDGLAHPHFDSALPRAAVLVTTGRLVGGAACRQQYNDRVQRNGEPGFDVWDRDVLRPMLAAEPACGLAAGSPGDLLALLGQIDQRKVTLASVETYTRRWASTSLQRVAIESAVLANRLRGHQRSDLAATAALAALRLPPRRRSRPAPARPLALRPRTQARRPRPAAPDPAGRPRPRLRRRHRRRHLRHRRRIHFGPLLAGRGTPMTRIAPAALACTFATSITGAAVYGLLALTTDGDIAPHWTLGLLCGTGGLIGGYLGARLQPHLPERALRLLLGVLATALATLYLVQSLAASR